MGKGLLILLGTFIVVAILHVVSMKMTKISEAKKIIITEKYLLVFLWNVFLMLSGGILQSPRKRMRLGWSFLIQFLVWSW